MDTVIVLDKRDVSTRQIHCQAPLMFVLPLKVYVLSRFVGHDSSNLI